MIRYVAADISFQEVPMQVSLVFYISGCRHRCPGCHSPQLQEDVGDPLTPEVIQDYCKKYEGMFNCICFMGDGGDWQALAHLMLESACQHKAVALYTGSTYEETPSFVRRIPDFLKVGPYIEKNGALTAYSTNQRFYFLKHWWEVNDFTHLFRKTYYEEASSDGEDQVYSEPEY